MGTDAAGPHPPDGGYSGMSGCKMGVAGLTSADTQRRRVSRRLETPGATGDQRRRMSVSICGAATAAAAEVAEAAEW